MMPTGSADALWILGRLLLGLYFAAAGIHHFSAIEPLSQCRTGRSVCRRTYSPTRSPMSAPAS